jgi:hypothetical protein
MEGRLILSRIRVSMAIYVEDQIEIFAWQTDSGGLVNVHAPATRPPAGEDESALVVVIIIIVIIVVVIQQRYSKEDKVATSNCCGTPYCVAAMDNGHNYHWRYQRLTQWRGAKSKPPPAWWCMGS